MSKLIQLPNGPYIEASKIIKIGQPWEDNPHINSWACTISYLDGDTIQFHVAFCNKTVVKNEESAKESVKRFVSYVNENL